MIVLSERSKGKLVHQGYGFIFDKASTDQKTNFWRCDQKSHGCKARMHTVASTNKFIRVMNEHNHDNRMLRLDEITRIKVITDDDEGETSLQLGDEVEDSIRRLTGAIYNRLQSQNDQLLANKRKRTRSPFDPNIVQFTEELDIPDDFKLFNRETFLLANSKDPKFHQLIDFPSRVLIFGRETNNLWSEQMKKIFLSNGLQNIQLFSNLYILWSERVSVNGTLYNFPVLYIFVENQKETTYSLMFRMIKELWPKFNPESITVDFDRHIINAVYEEFPEAAIHGCFSNMKQKMLDFLEENDQTEAYNSEDSKFGLNCRMISAIPFLPPDKIYSAFATLNAYFSTNNLDFNLLRWFEEEFIGKLVQNNHIRPPKFAHQIWSCHQRLLNYEAITNKYAKNSHERLQNELKESAQPSIFSYIEAIRQLQYYFDLKMEQFMVGAPVGFDKIDESSEKILTLLNNFNEHTNFVEFLREISLNIHDY